MKLIYCKLCQDVVRLIKDHDRKCSCGKSGGQYLDNLNAEYFGDNAVPIGFSNPDFRIALRNRPKEGLGTRFEAFVIPEMCDTFIRRDICQK